MIDLMYPFNDEYDETQPAGTANPGGGMATKGIAVQEALSKWYHVNLIRDFKELTSNMLIIEPLTPRLLNRDMNEWVEQLKACSAKKILYCSEMEIARWSPKTFADITEAVDIVTANTDYQKSIIRTLSAGQVKPYKLCDPINTKLFAPRKKKPIVFSAGRISHIKNSQFLIDVFRAVKSELKVETAYYGAADLWGNKPDPFDTFIEAEIKATVDTFSGNISREKLASKFSRALIYISKTTHDVYSSTHAEILSTENISLGGGHLLFTERPGISGLKTVDDFVYAIEKVLALPKKQIKQKGREGRDYILKECGYKAFLKQFQRIVHAL